MKKILIFTSTRAEYGLLKWIIKKLSHQFKVLVTAGGTHLSYEDGYTVKEIIRDKIQNLLELPFLTSSRDKTSLTSSVGNGLIQMSQIYQQHDPDYSIILGDRYELFIPSITSLLFNVPLIHLHGGEITEGVIDEQVRHAITKMSHIHMPSTELYAENISKMGEEDWRIFVVGAPGLENATKENQAGIRKVKKEIGIDLNEPTVICTYHPVTLEAGDTKSQINNVINSLSTLKNVQVIFTRPNADVGSEIIVKEVKMAVEKHKNKWFFFDSLGINLYHALLNYAKAIIGNSSSGIIEAPYFKIPTVNIGTRQKGRHMQESVLQCGYSEKEITEAINTALHDIKFRNKIKTIKSRFGDGNTSEYVLKAFGELTNLSKEKILKKKLDFTVKKDEWHSYY